MSENKPSWKSLTKDRKPFQYVPIKDGEKWPHTGNIHCVGQSKNPDSFFESLINATHKIDGSNLSMHIGCIEGKWSIIKINGRNTRVWDDTMGKNILEISYGSPDKLEKLPLAMFDYCVRLASKLTRDDGCPVDELYVYGEAYRMEGQRFVSWHPFGYQIPSSKSCETTGIKDITPTDDLENVQNLSLSITFLTQRTHELFVSAQVPEIPEVKTFKDFIELLANCTDHVICTPVCLFVGKLRDCINALFEQMKTLDRLFEGCFIIFEDRSQGFKWKTGLFEEQKRICSVSETMFKSRENIEAFSKLEYIFNMRPAYSERENMLVSKDKKESAKLKIVSLRQLQDDLLVACKREITKFTSLSEISSIPKASRKDLVSRLIDLSIAEVVQQYKESDCEISWSQAEMKRSALGVINPFVMKIDYVSSA